MSLALVFLVLVHSFMSIAVLPPALDVTSLESTEPECEAALSALRQGLNTRQLWADTMVDAGVRSPVGVLSGTSVQFGDFDACLSINSPVSPKFCLIDVSPTEPANASDVFQWSQLLWGVCVPAACSAQGLQATLQTYIDQQESTGQGMRVNINPQVCTTPTTAKSTWDLVDVTFCVAIATIILLVSVATVQEVLLEPEYDGFSPPKSVIQCLSARRGFHSLFRPEKPIDGVDLSALNGLHFFAFCLVTSGHRFGFHLLFMRLTNYRDVQWGFTNPWASMWTAHTDMFMDIFLFMSAFLLGMVYYSKLNRVFINPFTVYLTRISRIVPAYSLVMLFVASLFRHSGDGPLWNLFIGGESAKCREHWWTNLLFINNYVETSTMCMVTSWYIACDCQLFAVGTLLVLLIHKRPGAGAVVSGLLFLASGLSVFLATYIPDRAPFMMMYDMSFWRDSRTHDVFTTVFSQGHYRGTSYIIGLLAGVYVYRHQQEPLTKSSTYVFQILGLALSLGVYWSGALFTDLSHPPTRLVSALYASTHHTAFGLGLAFIVISFTLGHTTPLLRVLSWRGFVPLSKLSFCAYLCVVLPQLIWVGSSRTPVYLSFLEMVSYTIADVVISLAFALVLYLTVESPVRYLVKRLISDNKTEKLLPKSTKQKKQIN